METFDTEWTLDSQLEQEVHGNSLLIVIALVCLLGLGVLLRRRQLASRPRSSPV
jgi:LPXTG-motif cell wall-anchored protein